MTIIIKAITAVFAPNTSAFAWAWNIMALACGLLMRNDPSAMLKIFGCMFAFAVMGGVVVMLGAPLEAIGSVFGYVLIPSQALNAWALMNTESLDNKTAFGVLIVVVAYMIYWLTYIVPRNQRARGNETKEMKEARAEAENAIEPRIQHKLIVAQGYGLTAILAIALSVLIACYIQEQTERTFLTGLTVAVALFLCVMTKCIEFAVYLQNYREQEAAEPYHGRFLKQYGFWTIIVILYGVIDGTAMRSVGQKIGMTGSVALDTIIHHAPLIIAAILIKPKRPQIDLQPLINMAIQRKTIAGKDSKPAELEMPKLPETPRELKYTVIAVILCGITLYARAVTGYPTLINVLTAAATVLIGYCWLYNLPSAKSRLLFPAVTFSIGIADLWLYESLYLLKSPFLLCTIIAATSYYALGIHTTDDQPPPDNPKGHRPPFEPGEEWD